jgi:signal transduction histidine kinase
MSGTRRWDIVLGVSGEVLGVSRGAPAEWTGARLEDHAGAPASLRSAARAAVMEARGGAAFAKAVVDVRELDATVEVVVVAAVGVHRTATDVRALLPYAMSALERQARALDVELSVTTDPDVPGTLLLDPEKIAWVATALAGNAMRYVRRGTRQMPGGSIVVSAGFDGARGELVLVVADDGPGITPEIMGRLFHRAPGAPHATGLALVVVRDIVAAHGGSMDVASSTDAGDHGTTITVRIPAALRDGR